MASTIDFVEFVCEQISKVGDIRFKKMFGEYMVYADEKPIFLVCDNTVFVKCLPALLPCLENCEKGIPYNGAKEHYVLDIENRDLSEKVARILIENTQIPKRRK